MTVREMLASLGDLDEEAEVFIVTSSNGRHIDGKVAVAFVEELPLSGGAPVVACVPQFAVGGHSGQQPAMRLVHSDDTKPAA